MVEELVVSPDSNLILAVQRLIREEAARIRRQELLLVVPIIHLPRVHTAALANRKRVLLDRKAPAFRLLALVRFKRLDELRDDMRVLRRIRGRLAVRHGRSGVEVRC